MMSEHCLRGTLACIGIAALTMAPVLGHATRTPPMVDGAGAPAFCGTVLVRDGRTRPFEGYCRAVEAALQQNGPFDAALQKAHRVYASLYFTALANGRVVAAVFLRGSGDRLIDLGLMRALAKVRVPVGLAPSETFAMPIVLRAKIQSPAVAYRIDLARAP
ncbi:hypothetical protein [Acidiphilium acidophilum]|uniref:hypothetical protein n=1 Tax=Acidiphilium acidophilum TaxID=76588 RepID=UPI002E8E6EAD|nr:hypothetical protein [Acidiphilium acidophilum]